MTARLDNGVRRRADHGGDGWANTHRDALGNLYYLQDIDGFFGHVAFAANSADRLFAEYVPDRWDNQQSEQRSFALVALFDRKRSRLAAVSDRNKLSQHFYRFVCRVFADRQPDAPKFFYVVGGNTAPWTMMEIDIFTSDILGEYPLDSTADAWRRIWDLAGLARLRRELAAWIRTNEN